MDQHSHLDYHTHSISAIVSFGHLQVSLVIISNFLIILDWLFYTFHRGGMFSFHFPCLVDISHQLALTGLVHLCIACLFLPLHQTRWLFRITRSRDSTRNQTGFNQCFAPQGYGSMSSIPESENTERSATLVSGPGECWLMWNKYFHA